MLKTINVKVESNINMRWLELLREDENYNQKEFMKIYDQKQCLPFAIMDYRATLLKRRGQVVFKKDMNLEELEQLVLEPLDLVGLDIMYKNDWTIQEAYWMLKERNFQCHFTKIVTCNKTILYDKLLGLDSRYSYSKFTELREIYSTSTITYSCYRKELLKARTSEENKELLKDEESIEGLERLFLEIVDAETLDRLHNNGWTITKAFRACVKYGYFLKTLAMVKFF